MKSILKHTALVLAALAPLPAMAGKKTPAPPPKVDEAAVAVIKPYDKDGNYEISRAEFAAMEADFKASPTGPLKQFDRDGNGKLDDVVDLAYINIKLGELKMNEKPEAPKKKKKPAP